MSVLFRGATAHLRCFLQVLFRQCHPTKVELRAISLVVHHLSTYAYPLMHLSYHCFFCDGINTTTTASIWWHTPECELREYLGA